MRKYFELNELEQIAEFSRRSFGEIGELHPQIEIDDSMITRIMDMNCSIVGAIPIMVRIFHQLVSHNMLYYIEVYMKKFMASF